MNVETVKKILGEDAELFNVTEFEGVVVAKPKKKIPTKEFAKIADYLKSEGAVYERWNSETKKGGWFKFEVPHQGFVKPSHQSRDTLIQDAIAYFEHGIEKLREVEK